MEEIEYNTQRKPLVLPAYGRYVQQMVDYLLTIDNREERTRQAKLVLRVMATITSHLRNVKDYEQKLWNHLYIMSGYRLDVDSGYPNPLRAEVEAKPAPMVYPERTKNLDFYGANIPRMVDALAAHCPADQLEARGIALARQLKRIHIEWREENVSDGEILQDLARMSHGKIKLTLPEGETLLDAQALPTPSKTNKGNKRKHTAPQNGGGAGQHGKRKHNKRRR